MNNIFSTIPWLPLWKIVIYLIVNFFFQIHVLNKLRKVKCLEVSGAGKYYINKDIEFTSK